MLADGLSEHLLGHFSRCLRTTYEVPHMEPVKEPNGIGLGAGRGFDRLISQDISRASFR